MCLYTMTINSVGKFRIEIPQILLRKMPKNLEDAFCHTQYVRRLLTSDLTACDFQSDPNTSNFTYLALFPNFRARTPTDYRFTDNVTTVDFCVPDTGPTMTDPSTRVLPAEYFMFAEYGPDIYVQTDGRPFVKGLLNFAIGFR